MSVFVPLETSIFDPQFTLDPFPFIEPLYKQKNVLGFSSEGMNFCFRFEDCHDLIAAHGNVAREPVKTKESEAQAAAFAERFPTRAWHFQYSLTDVKVKAMLNRYLGVLLERISTAEIEQAFSVLGQKGTHTDYLEHVQLLPMRMLLSAWGFQFTEEQLLRLYNDSIALVKSFDNFENENLLEQGERGMAFNRDYVSEQFNMAAQGTLLNEFVNESRSSGVDDQYSIASLVTFLQSTPNTISISTALLLRNLLRYPEAVKPLRDDTGLINDSVIMEFLRRDNHVKALSRQVHTPFSLRGHELQAGEGLYIFYPGINLDPTHWDEPLSLNFQREFTRSNHNIFGGARYACIGSRIALKYFTDILPAIFQQLPEDARVVEDEIIIDGDWIAERVITHMPIYVP